MRSTPRTHELAVKLGLFGGGLGVIAGTIQALVGSQFPEWTGAKANPTGLGLLTVLLSVIAILSVWALRRSGSNPISPQRRAVIVVGLLVPAGLCFSTVGRLWYLPGVLLLIAAANVVWAGNAGELRIFVQAKWLRMMLSVLGGFELLMAVSAAPLLTVIIGIAGGLVLMAAPWLPGRASMRLLLILAGTLPFAVLTWWSVATPLLAVLAASIGVAAIRTAAAVTRPPASSTASNTGDPTSAPPAMQRVAAGGSNGDEGRIRGG